MTNIKLKLFHKFLAVSLATLALAALAASTTAATASAFVPPSGQHSCSGGHSICGP